MSNKLAKDPIAQNGHAPPDKRREYPAFTSSAGYRIRYKHLSPDTLPRLQAAARLALATEKPVIPTQRVQTGPDQWADVENPHDTTYQEAIEAWEAHVTEEQGRRFLTLCETYALIYEIDEDEVQALRTAHQAIGDPLDDMSDAQVFLWRIALPGPEDQLTLYGKLFGGLTEEAIAAQKAAFLGNLSRAATTPGA